MKILFIINALEHGGAARVLSILSNELASRGHSVFILADILHQKVNYNINSNVTVIPRIKKKYNKFTKHIQRLFVFSNMRKEIKNIKSDVIIGFMPKNYFWAKVLSLGLATPVIASERLDYNTNSDFFEYFIRNYIYRFADTVTFNTQRDIDFLGKKLPNKILMYNPVEYPILEKTTIRKKNVLAAGRLDGWHHKGFDSLIFVWSRIAKKYPEWKLEIAGGGNNESLTFLQDLVLKYEIKEQVNFLGFRTDMDILFQTSSVFVLSSRYEGSPNVLLEAMSQGCACIGFELDGRIKEFITSPEVGILVENQNYTELEKTISRLIEDESLRESLSEGAKKEVKRFSKDKITDNWEALFNKVTKTNLSGASYAG